MAPARMVRVENRNAVKRWIDWLNRGTVAGFCYSCLITVLGNQTSVFVFAEVTAFFFFNWMLCKMLSIHFIDDTKQICSLTVQWRITSVPWNILIHYWVMFLEFTCLGPVSHLADCDSWLETHTHIHIDDSGWRNMHLVCIWLGSCRKDLRLLLLSVLLMSFDVPLYTGICHLPKKRAKNAVIVLRWRHNQLRWSACK